MLPAGMRGWRWPPGWPWNSSPTTTAATVAAAATAALGTEEPPPVPPRLDPSTTLVDFGPLTQHSQSPELSVRLGNAGGGNLNAHAATQASWVRLRQVGDELYVAVDTGTVSEHEGAVTVDSDGGSATIEVKASVVPALQPTPSRRPRSP